MCERRFFIGSPGIGIGDGRGIWKKGRPGRYQDLKNPERNERDQVDWVSIVALLSHSSGEQEFPVFRQFVQCAGKPLLQLELIERCSFRALEFVRQING